MSVPLATLRRNSFLVWLHDRLGAPSRTAESSPLQALAAKPWPVAPSASARPGMAPTPLAMFSPATQLDVRQGQRIEFSQAEDAARYLDYWKSDTSAVMSLRAALQKLEPSAPVLFWSDDEVIARLGERIARGAVVATESARPPSLSVMPSAPAAPAAVEPPAVPVSQVLAAAVPKPPLLPVLEEVQIEGAEVLPEIEQSLEQVDITIGEIKAAPVSLAPTPSKVPGIETAMTDAGASVTSTLDKL